MWDRRGISQDTKLKIYIAVVLTVLLYTCESWTVYSRHARKFNHFHTQCLRIMLSIKWQDMGPDTEVLTRAGIHSIHTLLQKAQVRWAGHVTRMPDDRLPKQLLYGELCYDKRSVGGSGGSWGLGARNSVGPSAMVRPNVWHMGVLGPGL